jgi:hypothetical protein
MDEDAATSQGRFNLSGALPCLEWYIVNSKPNVSGLRTGSATLSQNRVDIATVNHCDVRGRLHSQG